MRLQNKTILITGANRGIGQALARELATHPVHLLLGMRDISAFVPIENHAALSITPIKLDLSSLGTISQDLKSASQHLRNLDILINNAGQFLAGPIDAQDQTKMATMVQVNLTGLMQVTALLLPTLRKRKGKIVNNASIAGYAYFPFNATYSATKAGVVAFSESLRRELKNIGVSVLHLVTPAVATDMLTDVNNTYEKHGRPINLGSVPAAAWAKRVVGAIEQDKSMLKPSGTTELIRLLSRGPRALIDLASRRLIKP